jgi:hypothetical protein
VAVVCDKAFFTKTQALITAKEQSGDGNLNEEEVANLQVQHYLFAV